MGAAYCRSQVCQWLPLGGRTLQQQACGRSPSTAGGSLGELHACEEQLPPHHISPECKACRGTASLQPALLCSWNAAVAVAPFSHQCGQTACSPKPKRQGEWLEVVGKFCATPSQTKRRRQVRLGKKWTCGRLRLTSPELVWQGWRQSHLSAGPAEPARTCRSIGSLWPPARRSSETRIKVRQFDRLAENSVVKFCGRCCFMRRWHRRQVAVDWPRAVFPTGDATPPIPSI